MSGSRPRQAKAVRSRPSAQASSSHGASREPRNFLVVGIGASAGGLDACRKLLSAVPGDTGMAFILVQHLDPTHQSMMVELLSGHTSLHVLEAADGMLIEPDHLYVIPPGTYLSVGDGALRLSQPQARHGARMPFDFLLHSLAQEYGALSVGVILSGTGTDGSLGMKSIKERHGFAIAQDPDEATYDGMPRNAIAAGAVDLVVPVAKIPDALAERGREMSLSNARLLPLQKTSGQDRLPKIIDLLRTKTAHDFTLYKKGTLQRRIERRMALSGIAPDDKARYLEILKNDGNELELLAKDLLINVTSFFRDRPVFDFLAERTIPDLIRNQTPDIPIRIWIAGCSSGEEAYSLAMLFREQITASEKSIKLQIFASDVDPDAVATAREGHYPESIEADVSPGRLARFFSKENQGYRVSPELRAAVVFTVQDVLSDPPFSRLDLVSCRNLLIYLRPEAQAKALSVFHFALREGGTLLLGNSETIGDVASRFEVISKLERLYRRVGRSRPEDFGFSINSVDSTRIPLRTGQTQTHSRQDTLAELCRRAVMEAYAPAAVLINRQYECVYSLGPTDRYMQMAPGHPTHDLLSMVHEGIRTKLRSALQQAEEENIRITVPNGRASHDQRAGSFSIAVQPVTSDGERLLLVCFIDEPESKQTRNGPTTPQDVTRAAELEHELAATRTELQGAIRNLEISGEEQKAINEEALSINEEYQSTNEELLTSKEELQSLNEELTALNSQLQETLERQRTTSNDLQNVLYSTDVATLFLDTDLNIRFFTPATKSLFKLIPGDVGRPLADLSSLATDDELLTDSRTVLETLSPVEREIEAPGGIWFIRRILPYRTHENGVEGVVITFTDITERRRISDALEEARRQADLANAAKSRFLAAASHDLRQPLQTLALLQGMLAMTVEGERAQKLVGRLDETLSAISGMLNALLDINQIEAGTVHAEKVSFSLNEIFDRLRDEFTYHAEAHGLTFHVVPCSLSIESDPRLLEQMIRNLLSNALKYTKSGKVLLGCRRRNGSLSIEICDTGVGIPETELLAIFDEYHQLDNAARERTRGLGLGLSIVRRLENLLDHRVSVRSQPGKGSIFSIEVALPPAIPVSGAEPARHDAEEIAAEDVHRAGTILIVEDDPEVRELLELLLKGEGHGVTTTPDGIAALELVTRGTTRPDLLLTDYNLPNGMNGLQLTTKLRERLHREIPVIVLTGDISASTLRDIALQSCIQLNKPVKLRELTQAIQRLLPIRHISTPAHATHATSTHPGRPIIFVVDDDAHIRAGIRSALEDDGRVVEDYASCEAFLDAYSPGGEACLLVDAYLQGMNGLELLKRLNEAGHHLPAIMITGSSDVPMVVEAMKAGASDFIEKPVSHSELIASVNRALEQSRDAGKLIAWRQSAADHVAGLTSRQRQIMDMVLAGHPSKNIAADLGISQRTVENHRASIMKKTGSKSLPALARLALAAASNEAEEPVSQQ